MQTNKWLNGTLHLMVQKTGKQHTCSAIIASPICTFPILTPVDRFSRDVHFVAIPKLPSASETRAGGPDRHRLGQGSPVYLPGMEGLLSNPQSHGEPLLGFSSTNQSLLCLSVFLLSSCVFHVPVSLSVFVCVRVSFLSGLDHTYPHTFLQSAHQLAAYLPRLYSHSSPDFCFLHRVSNSQAQLFCGIIVKVFQCSCYLN